MKKPPAIVGRVFVPGGLPTVTYNPRSGLHLERHVTEYLDERHKILSLSGPTKTGKTVLLRSLLHSPIWLSGGSISSVESFWADVADQLGIFTEHSVNEGAEDGTGRETTGGVNVGIGAAQRSASESTTRSRSSEQKRARPVDAAAREALRGYMNVIVIDDFHYIDQEVQLRIVRGLKDLVFDGLAVILASVPHRAYDAVRVEKEMTGRVEQLNIPFWSVDELTGIAEAGFGALNVKDRDGEIATRLASESFSSPHLMQEFCREVCKDNNIKVEQESRHDLSAPEWEAFFRDRASAASKAAFDLLARGPRQRADRKPRRLTSGRTVDIYGAVLAAIAETGPLTELTYEQLRAALRRALDEDPPQRHEITRVLDEMARIAKEQIEGEPVIDYDNELSTLHISDPFFAYFLRWGTHETASPASSEEAEVR